MLKYIQIADEETKLVNINDNDDMTAEEAISLGLSEEKHEVEQAWNGSWYLVGYAPEEPSKTTEEIRQQREFYYKQNCDPLTCEKIRKTALGEWSEEDEREYINRMTDIQATVEHLYPYPTEE